MKKTTLALLAAVGLTGAWSGDPGRNGPSGHLINPPTDFSVDSVETVSAQLSWKAPLAQDYMGPPFDEGPVTYELRYSTTPISGPGDYDFASLTPAVADLPSIGAAAYEPESAEVRELQQGTQYWFVLRSNYLDVFTDVGLDLTTGTDDVDPGPVTGLAAVPLTTASVLLSWNPGGDDGSVGVASDYEACYSTTGPIASEAAFLAADPVLQSEIIGALQVTLTVHGLAPGTEHWFAVRALDEVGNPGAIAGGSARTMDPPPPGSEGTGSPSCTGGAAGGFPGVGLLLALLAGALRRNS